MGNTFLKRMKNIGYRRDVDLLQKLFLHSGNDVSSEHDE